MSISKNVSTFVKIVFLKTMSLETRTSFHQKIPQIIYLYAKLLGYKRRNAEKLILYPQ